MALNDLLKNYEKSYVKDGTVKEIKRCENIDRCLNFVNGGTVAYALTLAGLKHIADATAFNGLTRFFINQFENGIGSKVEMLQNLASHYGDIVKALPYVLGTYLTANLAGHLVKKHARNKIRKRHLQTLSALKGSRKYMI